MEGKATKLSSALAGRYEEVLKVPFWRTVVVILGAVLGPMKPIARSHGPWL